MSEPDRLSPAEEADLAALADGRLDARRTADVLARVAEEPRLAAALERQRSAAAAITAAAGEIAAPPALRARIAELERSAATSRRRRLARRTRIDEPDPATPRASRAGRRPRRIDAAERETPRPRSRARPQLRIGAPRLAGGLALAACALLALMVVLGRGGATVDSVLAVAARPPAGVAAIGASPGPLLDEQLEGVRFPNYAARFGWQPAGVRRDDVDGRQTRTVFYRRDGRRIAYTVVAGDALGKPGGARAERREGVALLTLRRGDRTVVVWNRLGHTCVLSGEGVPGVELRELASWRGRGQVRFS